MADTDTLTETAPDAFTGLIANAVAAKMTPEFVEKEVNTRVEKLVIETIDRALRTYSDVGKMIEAAVQDALKVDRIDLPSYGHVVTQMLKAQIEARVSEVVAGRLAQDMDELLSLAPKEVKLSKIAEYMLETHDSDAWGEIITVIVEHNDHGSTWVYLDEDNVYAERDKYRCKHRLLIREDGTLAGAYVGDNTITPESKSYIGRVYGVEQRLRAYVACGTKIELDEDNVSRGKGDY